MGLLGFGDWGESIPRELLELSESYNAAEMVGGIESNSQDLLNDTWSNSLPGDPNYNKC